MPFTLVHGLIPYFLVCLFSKNRRLRALAFIAGMLPDLDGIPILFNTRLYYLIHHELFHQPIYGIVLAVPVAVLFKKYFGVRKSKSFIVFSCSFALHSIVDVFFTNWPVKLLWPFSLQEFSYPILAGYNWVLAIAVAVILVLHALLSGFLPAVKEKLWPKP